MGGNGGRVGGAIRSQFKQDAPLTALNTGHVTQYRDVIGGHFHPSFVSTNHQQPDDVRCTGLRQLFISTKFLNPTRLLLIEYEV